MFKNRAYVNGIGIGLIIGAILLQLMINVKGAAVKPGVDILQGKAALEDLDQKKLKDEASKYYQVFDKNETIYTQADLDKKIRDALKAASAVPAEGKKLAVYIPQGLTAAQVAELLYKSGVVADRNDFERLLSEQQIAGKIQAGYHVFVGSPEPQQVINILTGQQ